ncbi:MAG TPA: hypothetical protein VIA62_12930 [Thermoanaerobaculia bacterium]|nr:hypothetical protein [Thermoanaerobaculia bacterium]
MKKALKKLTLSRESIRRLSGNDLGEALGGLTLGTCGATCATRPVTCASCFGTICQP